MASRAEKRAELDQALYGFLEELDGDKGLNIIGIDEVGRGPLAGPLTVAAVSLPLDPRVSGLNDSKKLSAAQRESLSKELVKTVKAYSIIDIEATVIDCIGIVEAVRLGMKKALDEVVAKTSTPDVVLIDGKPLGIHPAEQAVIKGDGKVACIAAASILAKVHRDELMMGYSREHPLYGWHSNKGYGSAGHIAAIKEQGLSPLHRESFCRRILQETLF